METEKKFHYLLIGGGMAVDKAAEGIRSMDKTGTIGIISADSDGPYSRPALSKKLWTDPDFKDQMIALHTDQKADAKLFLNTAITALFPQEHFVQSESGERFDYDKLLLATGSSPRTIPGPKSDSVIAFRSWQDYRKLRKISGNGQHILVVGGGYLGNELAAALIQNNTRVTLITPDNVLEQKRFPAQLAKEYEQLFNERGVEIRHNTKALSYEKDGETVTLQLSTGDALQGDGAVIGIGAELNLEAAKVAGLRIDDYGLVVNHQLQTSDPDIWAAGDIISYSDKIMGQHQAGHVDHATNSGYAAGLSMAGKSIDYDHTPYFYSRVLGISWQAVGQTNVSMETLMQKLPNGKIIYYFQNDHLAGVLLWNITLDLDFVRSLLEKSLTKPVIEQWVSANPERAN